MQVDVSAEPGRPVARFDHFVVYQGSAVSFSAADLLANDVGAAGLSVVALSQPGAVGVLAGSVVEGFTFTPSDGAGFVGQDVDLDYVVVEPGGRVALGTLRIRVLAAGDTNRVPVGRDDLEWANPAATIQVFPLGNDFDPEGEGLELASVQKPAHGSISAVTGSWFNYVPDAGFAGTDVVTYVIRDGHGLLSSARVVVQVDVSAEPGRPVARFDHFVVYQGSAVSFSAADLLANDVGAAGLSVVALSQPGAVGVLAGSVVEGFTFTPSDGAGFVGQDVDLDYVVVEPGGRVALGTLRIRVLAAGDTNRAPVGRDDLEWANPAATIQVFPLGNDFDPEGEGLELASVQKPAHGSISAVTGSWFNYVPDAGFAGTDVVTYVIRDGHGLLSSARVVVQVDVSAEPGRPVARFDHFVVYQGSAVSFSAADLLANDVGAAGLSVVALSQPGAVGVLAGSVVEGFTFTPSDGAGFVGQDVDLDYVVVEPGGRVALGTLRIRVLAAGDTNQVPVAVADGRTTDGDTIQVFPLGNDFDPEGEGLELASVQKPAHGSISAVTGSWFNYVPDVGFAGTEVVTYRHP